MNNSTCFVVILQPQVELEIKEWVLKEKVWTLQIQKIMATECFSWGQFWPRMTSCEEKNPNAFSSHVICFTQRKPIYYFVYPIEDTYVTNTYKKEK